MYTDYSYLQKAVPIFKFLAWTLGLLSILSAVVIFFGGGTADMPRWTGVISLVMGAIYFFVFSTAGEIIRILLDIKAQIGIK